MAESRYSLFTAAQNLRRWFSGLTQTVTQTRKNQVELSVLETTKLRNFLSRKVRKCLEMSAKNIRPTFGTKRPRVRIPTLRPNLAEIFWFQPDFSAYSELFPMENFVTFPFDPNATQTGIRSGKRRNVQNRCLPEHFRQATQSFFALFFSKRYSLFTATHFLRHPFSHAVQIICYSQTQSIQTLSSTDDFVGQV